MKKLLFFTIIFASSIGHTSRLVEVEDYFSTKTSDFVKTRFPNRPFTVYVKLEQGDDVENRQKKIKTESTPLPYLDIVEEEIETIWNNPEIPVANLIGYLKSIYFKVDIDSDLEANEIETFKEDLFKSLKLSPISDKIEVAKMNWLKNPDAFERRMWLGFAALSPLLIFIIFFLISKLSTKALIKGLADPISNISKTTQNLAANAFAGNIPTTTANTLTSNNDPSSNSFNGSYIEIKKTFLEELNKNIDFFENINVENFEFLESLGKTNPALAGSLLTNLNKPTLEKLFSYSRNDWWLEAITKPIDVNFETLKVINEIKNILNKNNFSFRKKPFLNSKYANLDLVLSRLTEKEIGPLIKELPFEKSIGILKLLPYQKGLKIAKYVYPGQWGAFFSSDSKTAIEDRLAEKLLGDALKICPLRKIDEISKFLSDLENKKYLSLCSNLDEREFYRVLPQDSKLRERKTLYSLFEKPNEFIKEIINEITLNDISVIMTFCDRDECGKIFTQLNERQVFNLKKVIDSHKKNPVSQNERALVKEKVLNLLEAREKAEKLVNFDLSVLGNAAA